MARPSAKADKTRADICHCPSHPFQGRAGGTGYFLSPRSLGQCTGIQGLYRRRGATLQEVALRAASAAEPSGSTNCPRHQKGLPNQIAGEETADDGIKSLAKPCERIILLLGLPHLLDGPDTLDAFKMAGTGTLETFRYLGTLAARLWDAGNSALN